MCRRWVAAGHEVTVLTCAPNVPSGVVYEGAFVDGCGVVGVLVGASVLSQHPRKPPLGSGQHGAVLSPRPAATQRLCAPQSSIEVGDLDGIHVGDVVG